MKSVVALFSSVVVMVSLLGCNSGGGAGGGSSAALPDCPTGGTDLTYDNFGKAFFSSYCDSCHAGSQKPSLGTAAEIASWADQIYAQAGDGNSSMPPGNASAQPSVDERSNLAEWLACGAP